MTRLALLSVLGLATASALAQQDLLVKARSVVVAADTVLTGGELLVRQGRIAFVGSEIPADSRARARLLDHADATLVPGFVLAHGWLGQEADLAERANAFTPELRAARHSIRSRTNCRRWPGTESPAARWHRRRATWSAASLH